MSVLNKLAEKGATPTELKICQLVASKLKSEPFTIPELQDVFPRCKTSIKVHLKNMIEKGMIRRHSKGLYGLTSSRKTKKTQKRKIKK